MTSKRQSRREAVIKKSLKLQEKLEERAKKKGVANPEPSSVIETPAANDNSEVAANVEIVPNLAVTEGSEQIGDEEENIETIEEVVEELVDPNGNKMDDTEYNTRFKKVKVAELAVKYAIKRFNSKTVSDLDLNTYQSSLKNVTKKLEALEDNINDILVDLADEDPRITELETKQVDASEEVKENENEVKVIMKKIKESLPDKDKEEAQAERNKILKIQMESLYSKMKNLSTTLAAVKEAKLLSDNEVRHTLSNLSKWESAVERIKESKTKIDIDSVKATVEDSELALIKSDFDKLCGIFEGVKADLNKEDKDRSLFSLVKSVKDIAVYPSPFGGKPNENVFTFEQKMLDALATNQIPERDKVEVLRKYLRGAPRESVGDDIAKRFD